MIVVRLKGGHSNQIFQYATARALALRHNTELRLDLSWFDDIAEADTPRHYELGGYTIQEKIVKSTILCKIKLKLGLMSHYEQPGFAYDKNFLKLGPNTYLEGYFQNEKFFASIRDVLLKDFSYKELPTGENKKLLDKITNDNQSVSVHVRRGDYVQNPHANAFHGVKEVEYYTRAVERLTRSVKNPNLYVISNDPEWCKKNLKLGYPTVYVDHNNVGSDDMRLMRACRHNILANSSFSWWGAWLNTNPDKIVIAPEKWFNDESIDTSDLLPKDWIKI